MKWLAVMPVMMLIGGIMLLNGAGGSNEQEHDKSSDIVAVAFDAYEASWRKLSGDRASKLRAGEFVNQKAGDAWFLQQNMKALEQAFTPMLNSHYEQFGGDQWSADKEATVWEGYAR